MNNNMELKVKAVAENESFVRNVVASFCANENPSVETIADVKTAVSEAISNCIVHAYKGTTGEIIVKADITEKTLHIEISDNGVGIFDIEKALAPNFTTAEELERAGIGFTIMDTFMDSLKVESDAGGTNVIMTKKLA